jgi:signal peptidase I
MTHSVEDETRAAQNDSSGQPDPEPATPASSTGWTLLRDASVVIVIALLASLLIKTFLVQPFFIPSGSMESTLHGCPSCPNGDRVLVSKLTSHTGGLHRGDIVVFRDADGWLTPPHPTTRGLPSRFHDVLAFIGIAPTTSEGHLIKRVIGIGGDTVEARGGKVYVNGALLNEPYVFRGDSPSALDFRVTVPAGKLWVMGDHRSDSGDSRFHQDGPGKGFVAVKDVVGRAFVIIWPLDRVGTLS